MRSASHVSCCGVALLLGVCPAPCLGATPSASTELPGDVSEKDFPFEPENVEHELAPIGVQGSIEHVDTLMQFRDSNGSIQFGFAMGVQGTFGVRFGEHWAVLGGLDAAVGGAGDSNIFLGASGLVEWTPIQRVSFFSGIRGQATSSLVSHPTGSPGGGFGIPFGVWWNFPIENYPFGRCFRMGFRGIVVPVSSDPEFGVFVSESFMIGFLFR